MSRTIREEIEKILREKVKARGEGGKLIIASTDGLPIASSLPEEQSQDTNELSAYSMQIVNEVKKLLHEMGYSSPKFIQIKTEDGTHLNIYVRNDKIVIYITRGRFFKVSKISSYEPR